jgi:hypothetical protein
MRSFIFYTPPLRQIKLRRMRWAEHVARMGEECGKDREVDERMGSEWIFGRLRGRGCEVDSAGLG